jgi:hypothetical protein
MERMNDLETLATLDPAKDRTPSVGEMIRAEADVEPAHWAAASPLRQS